MCCTSSSLSGVEMTLGIVEWVSDQLVIVSFVSLELFFSSARREETVERKIRDRAATRMEEREETGFDPSGICVLGGGRVEIAMRGNGEMTLW